eukprot:jgi/Botrbrau1/12611/Bobra.0169s0138.1
MAETASAGAVKAASADAPALSLAKGASGQVLTPKCGACAPGFNPFDPSQFNGSLSGFRVLNLGSAAPVGTEGTRLVPAGAVLPQKDMGAYGPANECAFAGVVPSRKTRGPLRCHCGRHPRFRHLFCGAWERPIHFFRRQDSAVTKDCHMGANRSFRKIKTHCTQRNHPGRAVRRAMCAAPTLRGMAWCAVPTRQGHVHT